MQPVEVCRFAENNATFIFHCLAKLRIQLPASEFVYRHYETPPETIPDTKGIYMFYADCGAYGQYPVYIGKTEQGFKTRFDRHAIDGVIWMYNTDRFPIFPVPKKPNLGAVLLAFNSYRISYTLAESMFLYPFDFVLNKMENDFKRLKIYEIKENSHWLSYNIFEMSFNAMEFETTKLYNAFR